MSSMLRLAALQMKSATDPFDNLKRVASLLKEQHQSSIDLLVLPENFLSLDDKRYVEISETITAEGGPFFEQMGNLARQLNCYIVAGSVPSAMPESGPAFRQKVYARSYAFGPDGTVLQHYDKLHLFDVHVPDGSGPYRESDRFAHGNNLASFSCKGYQAGLSICYDLRFPELYQQQRQQGASILVVPAAFTALTGEAHWETLLRARAIENQCLVIAAGQCGKQEKSGRATWGHSMIIDPWGKILTQLEDEEGLIITEYDMSNLDRIRTNMPVQDHRRLN